jgi:tetratricopeptide (TPR) repeat protein
MVERNVPRMPALTRFSAGLDFHQNGEFRQAEECYRETIRIDPEHSDAIHLLGVVELQQGRPEESIEHLSQAVQLKPATAAYHNSYASALRQKKNYDEAIEHYLRAIDLNPGYAIAYHNLAGVFEEQGRLDEAERQYRQALELSPDLRAARDAIDRLHGRLTDRGGSDSPEAAETLETQCPVDPGVYGMPAVATGRKVVLHVGCGFPNPDSLEQRFRGEDWHELRLDIDPRTQPDIVASITDMSAVAANSVDAVWSSHNIEHLYGYEVPVALAEMHRVLKPGGLALLNVPDLQQVAHYIVADKLDDVAYVSPAGPVTPLDCLFGLGTAVAGGNHFMAHKTGFTATSLGTRLAAAGFVNVRLWTAPFNLWAEAWKPAANPSYG